MERRVTERTAELRRANEKLRKEVVERAHAEQELGELSGRLLRLQDEERRRLARELHDSTAQVLGAAAIGLDRARSCLGGGRVELGSLLEDSATHLEHATQEIRTLSFLLHPPMLDDLGLEYALPWYVEGFCRRSGIEVSLDVPADLGRMPEAVELTLYRIVQEALANVRHHSGSRTASITLFRDPGSVTLEIMDQGCGIRVSLETGSVVELGVGHRRHAREGAPARRRSRRSRGTRAAPWCVSACRCRPRRPPRQDGRGMSSPTPSSRRIVLADDHVVFRQGLRAILQQGASRWSARPPTVGRR